MFSNTKQSNRANFNFKFVFTELLLSKTVTPLRFPVSENIFKNENLRGVAVQVRC